MFIVYIYIILCISIVEKTRMREAGIGRLYKDDFVKGLRQQQRPTWDWRVEWRQSWAGNDVIIINRSISINGAEQQFSRASVGFNSRPAAKKTTHRSSTASSDGHRSADDEWMDDCSSCHRPHLFYRTSCVTHRRIRHLSSPTFHAALIYEANLESGPTRAESSMFALLLWFEAWLSDTAIHLTF